MSSTVLIVLAGLMGAGGVILAAAGAHVAPGAKLDSAAYMLMSHAAAVLGGAALLQQGQLRKAKWQAKTMGFESLPSAIIVSLFFQTILPISGRAGEITSI